MEVYATPLWAMLGWFEPGDIDAWAGQRGKTLLWMYVMVSNVLLVNLLIAMMGGAARTKVPRLTADHAAAHRTRRPPACSGPAL